MQSVFIVWIYENFSSKLGQSTLKMSQKQQTGGIEKTTQNPLFICLGGSVSPAKAFLLSTGKELRGALELTDPLSLLGSESVRSEKKKRIVGNSDQQKNMKNMKKTLNFDGFGGFLPFKDAFGSLPWPGCPRR